MEQAAVTDIPVPRISICMPISRDSAWLRDAIASILAQTMTDFEVIVTDDSGALGPIVAEFGDERLRYMANATRLGFAGNHCRAIAAARGEYVAFLHDDDCWEPGYLAAAADVLDRCAGVGLVLSGATEIDAQNQSLGRRPTSMQHGEQANPLADFLSQTFMMLLPSVTLVRRAALAANTMPWPDVIAADITMYIDVVNAGWRIFYLDIPLVSYRTHPQQIGTDRLALRNALVTVWSSYLFTDPQIEALRKERLGAVLLARAGAYVRLGKSVEARADLACARTTHRGTVGPRWYLLQALTFLPYVIPFATQVRAHLHDSVKMRHSGA